MTGSPLLRLIIVWVGLILIALVGWHLAGRNHSPPHPSLPSSPPLSPDRIDFTFTSTQEPTEIQIEASGSKVATLHPNHGLATASLPLVLPAEGLDLVISATWPQTTEASTRALRVQATRNAQLLADTTLWGDSSIRDVVTLAAPSRP